MTNGWSGRLAWLGAGLALGAVAAWGWGWLAGRHAPAEAVVEPPPVTERPGAAAGAAVGAPECYLGVVLAREAVDVAAEIDGTLASIGVRVGDPVSRGQVLATVDTSLLRHQLEIDKAALAGARAAQRRAVLEAERAAQENRRRQALEDLVSKEDLDAAQFDSERAAAELEAAEAEVAEAEARVAQLEETLNRAEIRAPFAGTVAQRYLDPGAMIAPGKNVVRLIRAGELLTRFAVPPEDASRLAVGLPVRVEVESSGLVLRAVVEHLAPEIDTASQMVFVEACLDAPAADLPSGAMARISTLVPGEVSPPPCLAQ